MDKHRVSWVALVWECLGNPFLFAAYNLPLSKKFAHIYYEKPWNFNTGFQISYTSFLLFIFENANTASLSEKLFSFLQRY
jgi:hypothetical protein